MEDLKFSCSDKRFLTQLHIDHEQYDPISDFKTQLEHAVFEKGPTNIIISSTEAKAIIAEYGELTFESYTSYKTKYLRS